MRADLGRVGGQVPEKRGVGEGERRKEEAEGEMIKRGGGKKKEQSRRKKILVGRGEERKNWEELHRAGLDVGVKGRRW